MTAERKINRDQLQSLGVPMHLIEEAMGIMELGLARPVPTEQLVAATLEKCRATLASMHPRAQEEPGLELQPALGSLAASYSWGQFIGSFQTSVIDRGVQFAQSHPGEAAIVLVDNHAVIDPQQWESEPALAMLRDVYQRAEETLQRVSARPICRLVILKDNPGAYDNRQLDVIRRAIAQPIIKSTFIVGSEHAEAFRRRSCAVVGDNVVFEMSQRGDSGIVVAEPLGIRDPARVIDVRRRAVELCRSATAVFHGDQLTPRFRDTLLANDNDRLRAVLADMMNSQA